MSDHLLLLVLNTDMWLTLCLMDGTGSEHCDVVNLMSYGCTGSEHCDVANLMSYGWYWI